MVRKRILHIIPSLDRAGAEKQLVLLAAGLPRDEFDVRVCALTRGGPLEEDLRAAGVPVTVIGKRWRVDPRSYWRLKRHVAETQPDLVQTWIFAANAYGRAAALACGVKHIVASERCVDPWKSLTQLTIDRWLARRTERIVVNSPAVRDFYVERRLPADKFVVIPNGVRPPATGDMSRQQILDALHLPPDSRLVGVVGRLWLQKRIKDVIWAADLLKVFRDDVHVLIFGDGPHRERLLKFRDQVRIADKVHFLGHRNDVGQWLPNLDLFLSTSEYEGQSNSILEAMTAGLPVIASDIPGTRDLIVDGVSGVLVPMGDRTGFASAMHRLLNNPEQARQLGLAGQQRVGAEFSVEKMIAGYVDLYRQLLG